MKQEIFNKRFVAFISGVIILASVALFQNCAQNGSFEGFSLRHNDGDMVFNEVDQVYHDDGSIEHAPIPQTQFTPVIADRWVLASMMEDIFGPTITNTLIFRSMSGDLSVLGAPCSLYDFSRILRADGSITLGLAKDACSNSSSPQAQGASVLPTGNVLRQALLNEMCIQAINLESSLNYVLSQIKAPSETGIPTNSVNNVRRLFFLFYRDKPEPHQQLIESLQLLVGTPGGAGTLEGWRTAVYTTCVSSHWQAL